MDTLRAIDGGAFINGGATIEPFTVVKRGTIIRDGCRISSCVRIEEDCYIGENTFIGHGVVMRPKTVLGSNCVVGHLTVFEGGSTVGKGTLIHAQCHITRGVTIGDNVFIAPFFVGANDKVMAHGRKDLRFKMEGYTIEDGVRIAIGVGVLPGVVIESNAVVGAGSLVTRDVPSNALVFGTPARIIGQVPENERI
jgi:acetyltransferase-like isoleucine patch superfamily enzyme